MKIKIDGWVLAMMCAASFGNSMPLAIMAVLMAIENGQS